MHPTETTASRTCCSRFTEAEAENVLQKTSDGSWNVEGCCNHCYVLTDLQHCPFCGAHLANEEIMAIEFIEQTKPEPLTFTRLRETNVLRCREGFGKEIKDWNSAQWACAAGGEMGELQNLIKKEFRGDSIPELDRKIGQEIADVVIYLDLLAASRGLDLGQIVRDKFNEVSMRVNSKRFL